MNAQLKDKIIFTEEQKQVLNGALLGDGNLSIHKNGKNACFSYCSKSLQHVEYVANFFCDYWSGEKITTTSYYDQRTEKIYTQSKVRTYTNESFTEIYEKWYKDKIKIIPEDLILTPLTCLIWYIGDGGICHSKRGENIKISTHCFSKEQQEKILLPQLEQFCPSLMHVKDDQYCIYIPHKNEEEFLKYIGKCPFEDYNYKWSIKKYINKKPSNHTENEKIFCEMYKNGMTYYAIAKHFGIEPNAVKYYLKKNKLY